MTIELFELLDTNRKAKYVWMAGKYIADKIDNEHKVSLFELKNFYVEVYYDPIENEITDIHPINRSRETEILSQYVNAFSFNMLLD